MRNKKSESRFAVPSPRLLLSLAGMLLIAAVFYLWPASSHGTQGRIAIDGEPLKVGSLSLSSDDGKAMSFAVIDGVFQSADSLPDGTYDAVVVVGNRLGMPVPQLENTAQEQFNGARFQLSVQIDSSNPILQIDLGSQDAILPKKTSQHSGAGLE